MSDDEIIRVKVAFTRELYVTSMVPMDFTATVVKIWKRLVAAFVTTVTSVINGSYC